MEYTAEFMVLCMMNRIEPSIIKQEGKILLVCPKVPSKEVQQKILGMIPKNYKAEFAEGINKRSYALLEQEMKTYGFSCVYHMCADNRVELLITGDIKSPVFQLNQAPPFWPNVTDILSRDPFVKSFAVIFNGKMLFDTKMAEELINAVTDTLRDIIEGQSGPRDEGMPSTDDVFKRVNSLEKPVPAIKVEDNRFDYDRDYLPPDVGTDLKILLESTQDSADFLKQLGVNL